MGTARELHLLVQRDIRVQKLEAELRKERKARETAEREAQRFHALLLQERVRAIVAKDKEGEA